MKIKILVVFLIAGTTLFSQTPFTRGVNLTSWYQKSGPGQIRFTKYTKEDFLDIQSLGCDVIRLPINMHSMVENENSYKLNETFLFFLDNTIDLAEEVGINLILDNHSFDPSESTTPAIEQMLLPVWTELAERYKDRSKLIYYEILNEPHGIGDALWNGIQQRAIYAIRAIDTVHTIVVGPAGWNSYNNLKYMPHYNDDNLIYTFHFYDPFLFTHQGANWTDPSMVPLSDVPFPYSADKMPAFPDDLKGTWIESSFNDYVNSGTINKVRELIDIAADFRDERDVSIFCGEFGVYIPNSENNDRIFWYSIVRNYLEQKGIAWTIWDYHGGFGIFNEDGNGLFEHDLNVNLVNALGLTAPEQSEYVIRPDSTDFDLYTDYYSKGVYESSNPAEGIINYYNDSDVYSGKYSIYFADGNQYAQVGFDFTPDKDLSLLVENNYELRFKIKGNSPGARFDVRFLDTKTDEPEDHPWRMRYTVDESSAEWDGQWHNVIIPLQDFTEHGAWDGQWYNPVGAYDWTRVDRFEIVAEHNSFAGVEFWFDDIKVVNPLTDVKQIHELPDEFRLDQNYPNPFNPSTKIRYTVAKQAHVKIIVYDVLGKRVTTLLDDIKSPGRYEVIFDGTGLSSGIYFIMYRTPPKVYTRKMMLVK